VPRSAFLEGAHEWEEPKLVQTRIVKRKTAEPQGAASLSLAVLEIDGEKKGSADRKMQLIGAGNARGPCRAWRSQVTARSRGPKTISCTDKSRGVLSGACLLKRGGKRAREEGTGFSRYPY
jgi:hypothetical protein